MNGLEKENVSPILKVTCTNKEKRLFVERVRQGGIIKEVTPNLILKENDEVVLSGRREFVIGEEDWIGPEVIDAQLLDFPAETLPVMITRKTFAGETINTIRAQKCMHGVSIRSIKRAGINVPVLAQTVVDAGDMLELTGMKREVELAAKQMGYVDRPTNQTGMIFVGLGILRRRFSRCINHPFGRYSNKPVHQWRCTYCRFTLWMAS